MARIRYLKPEFFSDEDLTELPFQTRLSFAGLWCYADKAGRLEDRPKYLKAMIFPYDNVDMEKQLQSLCKKPFIIRYEVERKHFIQIINWPKHQKPHHTETPSRIPPIPPSLKDKENGEGEGECNEPQSGVKEPLNNSDKTVKEPLKDKVLEFTELFNSIVKYIPKIHSPISQSREDKIKTRLKEQSNLSWWKIVFEKADNVLLPGKEGKKDWFPTFDWLVKNDGNALKVFEGNYDDAKRKVPKGFKSERLWLQMQEAKDEKERQKEIHSGLIEDKSDSPRDESND